MQKLKITKGEKFLMAVVVCSVALVLGVGVCRYNLEVDPVVNIPNPALPSPNAFDFYIRAWKTLETLKLAAPRSITVDQITDWTPHSGASPQQLAKIYPTASKEAWIKKNALTLRLIRQGFAYRSFYSWPASSATGFPSYIRFRELARLLAIESHAKAERGDWAGANRSGLDILRLGHDMPRGGMLPDALDSYGINTIGRELLNNILPHLDVAASRAAITKIEKLEADRVSFAEIMQEEKWHGQASLKNIMQKAGWRAEFLYYSRAPNIMGGLKNRAGLEMRSKQSCMDSFTRYMDAFIREARKPYVLQHPVPFPDDLVSALVGPSRTDAGWEVAHDKTDDAMLAVQFSLRAFRLGRGAFPKSLDELAPSYLKKIPLDPFDSGKTLHYHKTGNAYLLYSIGPDGRDDGGKAIDDASRWGKERYIIKHDSKGDYVAGINR